MKVVATATLVAMVVNARRANFSRTMSALLEKALDPEGSHVLAQEFLHGDGQCVRCANVLLKLKNRDEPFSTILDFALDDWNSLTYHKEEIDKPRSHH